MRNLERAIIYLILIIVGAAAFRAQTPGSPSALAAMNDDEIDAPRIAVCAVPSLLNQLMDSDRFRPQREELQRELRAELDDLVAEMQELEQRGQALQEDDPQLPDLFRKFQELRQKLGEKQQEIAQRLDAQNARQMVEAHGLIKASAAAVADDLGFNYVITTLDDQEELNQTSVEVVLRQILARPVLYAPIEADITEDVRDDLKLE